MTQCPDCRSPIHSLMMIDAKNEPEYYCERCAHTWPSAKLVSRPVQAPRQPVLA